jgi:hypothetical protein
VNKRAAAVDKQSAPLYNNFEEVNPSVDAIFYETVFVPFLFVAMRYTSQRRTNDGLREASFFTLCDKKRSATT